MALNITPIGTAPSPDPEAPKIYSDAYKHTIIDSVYQNENSLLSMVQGTPRLVEYYRQVLGNTEEVHAFQPGSGVYQQYTRIKEMILKELDFTPNFNQETAVMSKDGQAYVNFGLVPMKGDVFIADIGDGNAGWFTLTENPRLQEFTANKVYQIEYKQQGILTNAVYNELNSYVVEELVYSRDQHLNGGTPIITPGEYDLKKKVQSWAKTMVHHVSEMFYWDQQRTLAFKMNNAYYFDPYLTQAFNAMVNRDLLGVYPKPSMYSLEYGGNKRAQHGTYNIWDVIFRNDWNLLRNCKPGASIVDVKKFYNTRMHGNIRSTRFTGVVVTNPDDFQDMTGWISWHDAVPTLNPIPNYNINYLFSDEFYQGKPQGEFENLVVDVLKNDIVDLKRINDYLETFWDLKDWQQLYYTPILLLMINKSRKMGKLL